MEDGTFTISFTNQEIVDVLLEKAIADGKVTPFQVKQSQNIQAAVTASTDPKHPLNFQLLFTPRTSRSIA